MLTTTDFCYIVHLTYVMMIIIYLTHCQNNIESNVDAELLESHLVVCVVAKTPPCDFLLGKLAFHLQELCASCKWLRLSTSGKSHFRECHLRELEKLIYFPNYIQANKQRRAAQLYVVENLTL